MKHARQGRKRSGPTPEEQRERNSPAGRYWPVPNGSIREVCEQLDEAYNRGLGEPRDIRNRHPSSGVRAFDRGTIRGENESAPAAQRTPNRGLEPDPEHSGGQPYA